MDKATLHRMASELIKNRRAIKKLEARDKHLTSQIMQEMKNENLVGIPSGIMCPAGDLTLCQSEIYAMSISDLFKHFTKGFVVNHELASPRITKIRDEEGQRWVERHCDHVRTQFQILTKPAKAKAQVKVVLAGSI